ncbi:MAG: hypothetical protein AAB368_01460, partial [bacterium]
VCGLTKGTTPNWPGASARPSGTLDRAGTPTGTYFHPWPRNTPDTRARWLDTHRRGPFRTRLADPVWFHLPLRHSVLLFGYKLVAWLLLG